MVGRVSSRLLSLVIGIGITGGGVTGVNVYLHHNIKYEAGNEIVASKIDGIASWTEVKIDKEDGSVAVERGLGPLGVFAGKRLDLYADSVNGPVNRIKINTGMFRRGPMFLTLKRTEDYEQWSDYFDGAVTGLVAEIERFESHLNQR